MEEKKITLIEGTFQSGEAFELLTKLINYKIQFHQQDEFSKSIRNVAQTQHAQHRITSLQEALHEVQQFVKAGHEIGSKFKIYSNICIEREA